ncbi:hypothetical protein ALO_18335 [Acetonema longum DSM 6540]|uniref:Uncharacterized protein n=1 Tax=Acetonema longum DSM 6540 TaxID=1009370 RepID=F7NNH6_9FIRM|nr:hypothetical protein ALO_18335 [Acetonema longum DSM 6540]
MSFETWDKFAGTFLHGRAEKPRISDIFQVTQDAMIGKNLILDCYENTSCKLYAINRQNPSLFAKQLPFISIKQIKKHGENPCF